MVQMEFPPVPAGLGIKEENAHPFTGLRCASQEGVFVSDHDCIYGSGVLVVDGSSVPQNITNQTAWTALTLARSRMPFPCTPCISYLQNNATPNNGQTFSIRVTGVDQFGQLVQETVEGQVTAASRTIGTPPAPYKRRTRLWLSKVFDYITTVEYKASSVQGTDDYLEVGMHFDWDFSGNEAPYENYIAQANQGVGTPLRVNPYGSSVGTLFAEMLGLQLVNLDPQVFQLIAGTNANPAVYSLLPSDAEMAITGFSIANPTVVTVNPGHGIVGHATNAPVRFPVRIKGDSLKPWLNGDWIATYVSATEFSIPVNVTSTHSSYSGIKCYFPSPQVRYNRLTPVRLGGLQSPNPATLNALHFATFLDPWKFSIPVNATAAGTEGTVEVLESPVVDVQPYNSTTPGFRGGFRMGINASGFVGTPHKWSIYMAKAFGSLTTPRLLVVGQSDGDAGTTVDTDGDAVVDENIIFPWPRHARVGFKALFRSGLGTQRSAMGTPTYPR